MHWSLMVLIGAILNVMVNYGYKVLDRQNIFLIAACAFAIASVALFNYSAIIKKANFSEVATGWSPLIILGLGCGFALVTVLFVTALGKGPLSLVDPLWACIYALVSVLVGMTLLREAPSMAALAGIGLYLAGAFLMARG